jgi:hypothetical protein
MASVGLARVQQATAFAVAFVIALLAAGCGGDDDPAPDPASTPSAAAFPPANGTVEETLAGTKPADDLVAALANSDYVVGKNRLAFGVFNVDGTQADAVDAAVYLSHGPSGQAEGPFPARRESLATDGAFISQTTSTDPGAAKDVYVTEVDLKEPGEWRPVVVFDRDGDLAATRMTSLVARTQDPIPAVGDKAPVVRTPTVDDVGDVTKIDTRVPPDSMHDVDAADVIGKKPVVLLFATPALCQSRVCGPVVDVEEQVKNERPDAAAYIHEEIYQGNNANNPITQPFAAYQPTNVRLQSEPWLYVINSDGTISTRIQGAFSKNELDAALDKVH